MKFNILICVLLLLLLIPSVQADFINGGFESCDFAPGWTPFYSSLGGGPGTTDVNLSYGYTDCGMIGHGYKSRAGVYQTVNYTGINELSFRVKINSAGNAFDVSIAGYAACYSNSTVGDWRYATCDVSGITGERQTTLSAYSTTLNGYNYNLDNVRLDDYSPPSYNISGIVTSSAGGTISAATITLNNSGGSTTSNDTGYYSIIDVITGTYTITAASPTHEDYSDTVSITSDTEKNFIMTRLTPTINNQGIIDSSENSLRIGWHENPVVDSVKIYQGTDTNLIQTESTPYISTWSYTVPNLNADTGYNFWLQPYDGAVAGAKYYVTGKTEGGGGGGGGAVPPADPTPYGTPTPIITPRPTPGPTPPPWTNITEDEWTELTITEQEYILLQKELQDKLNATGTYTMKPININLWWLILLIGIGSTVYGSQKEKGEFLFVGGIVTVVIAMLKLGLF